MKKIFSLSNLTLLVALSLSTVAAYYSIIGLTAIFAGAVIPIIVMGSILEVGKITATVWLRKYWSRAGFVLKMYLVPAVILLAFLTSMGIFGFLSKAHTDQSLVSGDVLAKIAIYDEKIKIAKDNIEANRKALKQMDEAVDQTMARSTSETGADKAVQVRRAQAKERARLLAEIQAEQKTITKLNEERAPIAAEVRKVEAEVGPIKYIAAFIYGDNPDANLLESAVRWVIILIVIVFDPLAIALVLAANASKEWDIIKEDSKSEKDAEKNLAPVTNDVMVEETVAPASESNLAPEIEETPQRPAGMRFDDPGEHPLDHNQADEEPIIEEPKEQIIDWKNEHPYLFKKSKGFQDQTPMVYREEKPIEITEAELNATEAVAVKPAPEPLKEVDGGYVIYDGKMISKDALKEMKPQLFKLTADSMSPITTNFGIQFPRFANKGDMFIRVDVLPNRVFKYDGKRWYEINKETTDAYLQDENYIKFLIEKLEAGEYDIETLSDKEREQIEYYLNSSK